MLTNVKGREKNEQQQSQESTGIILIEYYNEHRGDKCEE